MKSYLWRVYNASHRGIIEWLRHNPEEVCAILPEWQALINCLRA
jgi:membrane-bound lytic murein transglycosylase